MKIGQFVDVAVTAVNPDGSQAAIPPGVLMVSADSAAVSATLVNDTTVKVQGASVGSSNVTFSAPGFKPCTLSFTIEDLPQLVATPGSVQG